MEREQFMSMTPELNERKTVLIVEDEAFMQNLFCNTLEREGFKTISAVDGQAAVAMLPTLVADLIVLDLMLPNLSGLKVLEAIRADSRLKDLPVLVLSNAYLPEIAAKAKLAGATAGLTKSACSPTRLLRTVRELLKISSTSAAKPYPQDKSSEPILLAMKPSGVGQPPVPSSESSETGRASPLGYDPLGGAQKQHQIVEPNSPDCRAKKAGFGDYVDCLVESSRACSFALPFANGFLCRHPNNLQIAARSSGGK